MKVDQQIADTTLCYPRGILSKWPQDCCDGGWFNKTLAKSLLIDAVDASQLPPNDIVNNVPCPRSFCAD